MNSHGVAIRLFREELIELIVRFINKLSKNLIFSHFEEMNDKDSDLAKVALKSKVAMKNSKKMSIIKMQSQSKKQNSKKNNNNR